jgi:hypothetical protein
MIQSVWDFLGMAATTAIPFSAAFIFAEVALHFMGLGRNCPKGK